MDVSRSLIMASINEVKILSNVRLIHQRTNRLITSTDNLHVLFYLTGDVRGTMTCYLCLDGFELVPMERNYIFPLFVEAMNILVGKQISHDQNLKDFKIKLSPPKLSMITKNLSLLDPETIQTYELEIEGYKFKTNIQYNLEVLS